MAEVYSAHTMSSSSETLYGDQDDNALNAMDTVKALHSDELASLSVDDQKLKAPPETFQHLLLKTLHSYLTFLTTTWWHSILALFAPGMTVLDHITLFLFAFVASIIISVMMLVCVLAHVPVLVWLFEKWAHMEADDLSLVNASYPKLFESMTHAQLDAARHSMSEPIRNSASTVAHRVFDLDVARFLLQCAALTYERTSAPVQQAVDKAKSASGSDKKPQSGRHHPKGAGKHARQVLGESGAQQMMSALHDSKGETKLAAWANSMIPPIKYSSVSELNGTDSAFCGIFWDPNSTWIVLAFKGTDPTEFSEWASDFQYIPREAGERITGFGQVHGGFYDRLFAPTSSGLSPFDTIASAVRAVADEVSTANASSKINLFVTGHSLGCAMASLAYACLISEPFVLGSNVIIRDAYLFAAPIVCDPKSVAAFNECLDASTTYEEGPYVRTLWRVVNRQDVVATALPSLGDDRLKGSLRNLFAFAHLGAELRMGSQRAPSYVRGGSLKPDTWVGIRSKLDLQTVNVMNTQGMPPVIRWSQDIPLVGRFASHATTMYWDAITQLQVGRAYWAGS
ncbi:alpha/beta-hydrolase [Calocera cornea HHB12733]|uniref:Alpha/beta-hydrolase n=1 Tax=Calocera cornea HHB12733 TaxID=1353952 RepID=A0A165GJR8_9BASI|nr:alpha/beta-hydrolase [Calocera cornea HHB12733]